MLIYSYIVDDGITTNHFSFIQIRSALAAMNKIMLTSNIFYSEIQSVPQFN